MHKILPNQSVRIITVVIAVAADVDPNSVADEISAHLSGNGTCDKESHILDWAYACSDGVVVVASENPEEGEIFLGGVKIEGDIDLLPDQHLTAVELQARYDKLNPSPHAWSEHPVWDRKDWQFNVRERNTSCSYWEWVANTIEMHICENQDVSSEVLAVAVSPAGFIVEQMKTIKELCFEDACSLCGDQFTPEDVSWLAPGTLYPICEKCSPVVTTEAI